MAAASPRSAARAGSPAMRARKGLLRGLRASEGAALARRRRHGRVRAERHLAYEALRHIQGRGLARPL
jgi:hypothetical protein